jgi:hypothetical protein
MAEELMRIDMAPLSAVPSQYSDFEFADLFDGRLFWLLLVHWACDSTALCLPAVVAEETAQICGRASVACSSLNMDPDSQDAARAALASFLPPPAALEPTLLMRFSPSPLIETVLGDLEGSLADFCVQPDADATEEGAPGPYDDQRHWHSKRKLDSKDTDAFAAQVRIGFLCAIFLCMYECYDVLWIIYLFIFEALHLRCHQSWCDVPQMKEGQGETSLAIDIDEKEVVVRVISARVAGIQPKRIIQIDEERMWVTQVKLHVAVPVRLVISLPPTS